MNNLCYIFFVFVLFFFSFYINSPMCTWLFRKHETLSRIPKLLLIPSLLYCSSNLALCLSFNKPCLVISMYLYKYIYIYNIYIYKGAHRHRYTQTHTHTHAHTHTYILYIYTHISIICMIFINIYTFIV